MMTREERAKQFMPFDAMKGLKEALKVREERHRRVGRRELSEDSKDNLSKSLIKLCVGDTIKIFYFCSFHNIKRTGRVNFINKLENYIILDEEKIFFDDIYKIEIQ